MRQESDSTMRTCSYCDGAGCELCDGTGEQWTTFVRVGGDRAVARVRGSKRLDAENEAALAAVFMVALEKMGGKSEFDALLEKLDREARSEPRVSTVLSKAKCHRGTKGCIVLENHTKCIVPR